MGRYKLIVFTSAVAGREDEFNEWYTNHHLKDVVDIPGFRSAQRLKLHSITAGTFRNDYLAIYEIDGEDPETVMAALSSRADSGQMSISGSLDQESVNCAVFEICSSEVVTVAD